MSPLPDQKSTLVERLRHTPGRRVLQVARLAELSEGTRRVVLHGADLEPTFPFLARAVADHVKIVLPDEDSGRVVLPFRTEHGPVRDDGRAPVMRDYTVRRFDPERRELTLDFVLHTDGPAGRWAADARPGDHLGVLGPRGSQVMPTQCARYLVVADPSALPASERLLEELPPEVAVRVVVVHDGREARLLAGEDRARVDRLVCRPDEAAPRVLEALAEHPPEPGTFVWAAGETSVMEVLRRHLRHDRGFDADHVVVRGYWRRSSAAGTAQRVTDSARGTASAPSR